MRWRNQPAGRRVQPVPEREPIPRPPDPPGRTPGSQSPTGPKPSSAGTGVRLLQRRFEGEREGGKKKKKEEKKKEEKEKMTPAGVPIAAPCNGSCAQKGQDLLRSFSRSATNVGGHNKEQHPGLKEASVSLPDPKKTQNQPSHLCNEFSYDRSLSGPVRIRH